MLSGGGCRCHRGEAVGEGFAHERGQFTHCMSDIVNSGGHQVDGVIAARVDRLDDFTKRCRHDHRALGGRACIGCIRRVSSNIRGTESGGKGHLSG